MYIFIVYKIYILEMESYDVVENGNINCQRHGILTNGILSINING